MAMGTQLGYDPGNFYVWRASDGFAIHMSLTLVTQSQFPTVPQPWRNIAEYCSAAAWILPFGATLIEDFKLLPASKNSGELTTHCSTSPAEWRRQATNREPSVSFGPGRMAI